MQVSVEKVSNVERRLTIVVPSSKLEEAYTVQINRFAKKANIKGFRPGKAPISYIQQRFGQDARNEALSDVIQEALYEAIRSNALNPIDTPRVEPKAIAPGQPLEFVASFEVLPEIENVLFALENIEKLNVDVTSTDIDYVVKQLSKQYTKWKVVDREAATNDRVVIDFTPIIDGKEEDDKKAQNLPLELGSNAMLPGFEDGLIGAKAGEDRHLKLTFPDDFPVKEQAGKPVEFKVNVKQVFAADVPELNEAFVHQLGVKSGKIEDLNQQIQQSLELERDRLVKESLKNQVFQHLLDQNPLEVPRSLVAREAKKIHDEVYPQHQHHDHHDHSEEEMTQFNEIAKKRVALGLLISEFAKKSELKPDLSRVQKRIQEIASAYESPQEVVEWLSSEGRRSGIEAQVLEDLVLEKLLEGVPVKEKSISYAELKGIRI